MYDRIQSMVSKHLLKLLCDGPFKLVEFHNRDGKYLYFNQQCDIPVLLIYLTTGSMDKYLYIIKKIDFLIIDRHGSGAQVNWYFVPYTVALETENHAHPRPLTRIFLN